MLGTTSTMVNGNLVYGSDPTTGPVRTHRRRRGWWNWQAPVGGGWQTMGWPQQNWANGNWPQQNWAGIQVAPGYYAG